MRARLAGALLLLWLRGRQRVRRLPRGRQEQVDSGCRPSRRRRRRRRLRPWRRRPSRRHPSAHRRRPSPPRRRRPRPPRPTAAPPTAPPTTTTIPLPPDVFDPACVRVIQRGESLSLIADAYDDPTVTARSLAEENGIGDADAINFGELLDVCPGNKIDDISGDERGVAEAAVGSSGVAAQQQQAQRAVRRLRVAAARRRRCVRPVHPPAALRGPDGAAPADQQGRHGAGQRGGADPPVGAVDRDPGRTRRSHRRGGWSSTRPARSCSPAKAATA